MKRFSKKRWDKNKTTWEQSSGDSIPDKKKKPSKVSSKWGGVCLQRQQQRRQFDCSALVAAFSNQRKVTPVPSSSFLSPVVKGNNSDCTGPGTTVN